jgi:hypothetical protein
LKSPTSSGLGPTDECKPDIFRSACSMAQLTRELTSLREASSKCGEQGPWTSMRMLPSSNPTERPTRSHHRDIREFPSHHQDSTSASGILRERQVCLPPTSYQILMWNNNELANRDLTQTACLTHTMSIAVLLRPFDHPIWL